MRNYLVPLYLIALQQFVFGTDYASDTTISDSGLLFLKTSDIIITGDSWTIVLSVNVTQHLINAQNLEKKVGELRNISGIDELEMNRLLRVTEQLVEVTEAMHDILTKHVRMKRSLFNWVAPLFGFNDNSGEIERLQNGLNRLETEQMFQKMLFEQQASAIQGLQSDLGKVANEQISQRQLIDWHIAFTQELQSDLGKLASEQMSQKQLTDWHIAFTKGLENDIGKLAEMQIFQRQLIDEHISFTNSLNLKVENNFKRIDYLTEAIYYELDRIDKEFKKIDNNFKLMEERIEHLRQATSKLRILQLESLQGLIMANRLQHALEMAGEGKLSFYLLSPKELQKELIKISSLLPAGSKLLRGLSVDDMFKYREMAKVSVLASPKQIFIAIRLPLISIETSFSAYSVNVMPIFSEELDYALKVVPESDYVVVSNDRQHYSLVNSDYFNKCYGQKPMICPADITLLSRFVPTCIGVSYFGETTEIGTSCNKKLVLNGEDFAWFEDKEHNGWIYSLKRKTSVTLACHDKMGKTIKLDKGIGYLSNTSHCRIIGDNFKLLRASAGGSSLKHGDDTYLLKPFNQNHSPLILSDEEKSLLTNITKINLIINKIKQSKRVKKDTSKLLEVPLDYLFNDNYDQYEHFEDYGGRHHRLEVETITLIFICLGASVISSVVASLLILYLCSKRMTSNNRSLQPYDPLSERLCSNQYPLQPNPLINFNNTSLIDN